MTENPEGKQYDLEERSFEFAKQVRAFIKVLPKTMANFEDARQLVRASGSVAANYIEANNSLSKKDFVMRIKICRKEDKECRLWLRLLDNEEKQDVHKGQESLTGEAAELVNIFGAILRKSQ